MSKINELIQTLCPDGVEYKTLKDVLTIKNGRDYKSFNQGNVPVYGSGGIMAYVDTYAYDGPSVLIPRKGSLSNIFYVEGQFWTVDTIFYTIIDESQVLPKYVFYYLQNAHLEKLNQAGGVPSLSQGVLNPYPIPVPPPSVQEEIVRILDEYTDLEAELEAKLLEEIELKQKQYEFYRDELLTFGDDVERIATEDLVESKFWLMPATPSYVDSGVRYITSKNIKNGKIDFSTASFISKEDYEELSKNRYVKTGDLLITMIGTIGECAFVEDETEFYGQNLYLVRLDDSKINCRYYKYYFEKSKSSLIAKKNDSSQGYLKAGSIDGLIIPVPSPTEQERIVKILDKYDTYTRDMISTLNTELESRKKQYAYYRDQLLTFKRKE